MAPHVSAPRVRPLSGRANECATLDAMLERVRNGESTVLVLWDEARIGKTALLTYCGGRASGVRGLRGAGGPTPCPSPSLPAFWLLVRGRSG